MSTRRAFLKKLFKFLSIPLFPTAFTAFLASCFSESIVVDEDYRSDHFDGKYFFHPNHKIDRKSFSEIMKWRLTRKSGLWPKVVSVKQSIPSLRVNGGELRATFIGHATILIQTGGLNLLFDPHWGERASPVTFAGPKRVALPGVALDHLPPIDYIFISHNHHDHLHFQTLKEIQSRQDKSIKLITPLGNKSIIDLGIPKHRYQIIEQDWGDQLRINDTMTVVTQPTYHWSARGISDGYQALWCAFVIISPNGNIYFAGDTGFGYGNAAGDQFKKTQKQFGQFRFSMLPIGAYEPRSIMEAQHINPQEAVWAAELLNSKYNLAIHLQTFKDLTDEGYDDPVRSLNTALKNTKLNPNHFRVLQAGESWDIPSVN